MPSPNTASLSPAKRLLLEKILREKREQEAARLPIAPRPDRSHWPLSWSQRRLWFIDQLEGASANYNMPLALRIEGALDPDGVFAALDRIVARHEVLRSRIVREQGEPVQSLSAAQAPRWIDLSEDAEREAALARLFAEEAAHVFRLEHGGLFRAALVRLDRADHVLMLNMHHIVSDGWSMNVLMRELFEAYAALRSEREPAWAPLPIQYADYAHWQSDRGAPMLARQSAYWRGALQGAPALLELPLDRPRNAAHDARAGVAACAIEGGEARALDALCREEGATPFMALLALWSLLLSRLCGQNDIVVGTPVANRNRPELEPLIGFFANTLPIRTKIDESVGFRALLRAVKDTALAAYEHQDLPFDRLVEELNPVRSLSHSPIFQTLFAYRSGDGGGLPSSELQVRPIAPPQRMAKFDLTFDVVATAAAGAAERYDCECVYRASLFDHAHIAGYLDAYRTLLRQVLAAPDRPLRALVLRSAEDYCRVDAPWRGRVPASESTGSLLDLFAAQVADDGDALAVVDAERSLSRRALDEASNRLAHWLCGQGVRPEVAVAVGLRRSADVAVAFLAVLKAGGTYLPLAPTLPIERARYVLSLAQPMLLLGEAALAERHRNIVEGMHAEASDRGQHTAVASVADLDAEDAPWRDCAATALDLSLPPELRSYLIFTSGSTGKPKGVQLTHRGLCNLAQWQRRHFGLGAHDRVLQFSSLGFDASVWEMTMALAAGAQLHFADGDALMPGGGLEQTLHRRGITAATLPPSVLGLLDAAAYPALRCVVSAGEACSRELVERWSAGRAFYNAYGPSETTVCATSTPPCATDLASVTIGTPIDRFEAHVLDAQLRPVPPGCLGELWIGGIGLARGYCRDPGRTATRFVPNPFSNVPGARLYRTGDVVRALANGEIQFIGRRDHQIKLRGFRIELGELESALLAVDGVQDACAVARMRADDPAQAEALLAFVVRNDPELSVNALQHALAEALPDYMRPAAIQCLEAMPLTANGKIDRDALATMPIRLPRSEAAPPQTDTERALADLWAAALGLDPQAADAGIGRHDDFFAVGGHSLLAVKLLDAVRVRFACSLPLSALYRAPTLAAMAAAIDAANADTAASDTADAADDAASLVRLAGEQSTFEQAESAPPLFLIHALDGDVGVYLPLASRLAEGTGTVVYGIRQRMSGPAQTLAEMAQTYVGLIRAQQAHGPYRVAGWSFGGALAIEVAACLRAQGQALAFVCAIDSGIPEIAGIDAIMPLDALVADLCAQHGEIALARRIGLDETWLQEASGAQNDSHAARVRRRAIGNVLALLRATPSHLETQRHPDVFHYCYAEQQSAETLQRKLASLRFGAGSPLHRIGGDHRSMLRPPHVDALAQIVRDVLNPISTTHPAGNDR